MSRKYRLIQTRFTNLTIEGKLTPKEVKQSNSKLHLVGSKALTDALNQETFIGEFRKEQPIGKVIINGKNVYKIIDFIGKKARDYFGVFNQYALIKI